MAFEKITFSCEDRDLIISFLDAIPFNGFQETDEGFIAYISKDQFRKEHEEQIEALKKQFSFEYALESIKNENWNEKWESSFQPVTIDNFCSIRADFHPAVPNMEYDIIINPKMAFGTGHHATTSAVISVMRSLNFTDKKVFDYGCGTGILGILAEKLGAEEIFCIDIEEESYLNSIENAANNGCKKMTIEQGDISLLKDSYDIILANINRKVILDSIPTLSKHLKTDGILVISGILKEDEGLVVQKLKDHNFIEKQIKEINGWLCILAENLV